MNPTPLKKYGLCYGKAQITLSLHEVLLAMTDGKRLRASPRPWEWRHRKEVGQGRGKLPRCRLDYTPAVSSMG